MIEPITIESKQPLRTNKKPLLIIIAIIFLVLIGGVMVIKRPPQSSNKEKETMVESNVPSPTEQPKIDKDSVKIQVLNGTGTPGQAGQAVDALKKAGYNADNIKAGNADEFNKKVTTVAYRQGFKDVAEDIKQTLADIFVDVKIDSTSLAEDSEYDIVVTTGGKLYEATSAAETITPTKIVETETPTPTTTVTPTP